MRFMASAVAITALVAAGAALAAPVRLAPHKAIYDLSLNTSDGPRGIEAARGRIVYDFAGDACEGYALSFRQVTVLDTGQGEPRTTDTRSTTFEDGEGTNFRFRSETISGSGQSRAVDGNAERRKNGNLAVRITRPKPDKFEPAVEAVFPSAHMKMLIVAARAGETILSAKVFDGSDDGRRVYDTLAVIGKRIEPGAGVDLEEAAKKPDLETLPRWPVKISYFTPGEGERTPIYTISFEFYENGVSRALKLDYGDFTLTGVMKKVDLAAASVCKR